MKDANWVILVGAMPRRAGMERKELLAVNGKIFKTQGQAINDHAANDVRVFVVGNPCNTNCLIAMHHAPDIPKDRFYAMTLLDELRARYQLAAKAGVDVDRITQMTIWGNHSSTQFPDFYHAEINHKPATEVIQDLDWLQGPFIETVQQRGAAVIKARGASSAASAANAALMSVYHLTHDTPQGERFSVGRASQGEYGVDEGLIFSFPCRTEAGQLKVITGIAHNDFAQAKIQATLNELREEAEAVRGLGA
jgi:malate dehydrogenase